MNEQELERIARRLGEQPAARLNVERTAAAVVARLRTPETVVVARWWSSPSLLRLAAAVSITVGAGLLGYRALPRSSASRMPDVPIAALQTLSQDELEEVLDSLAVDAPPHENVVVGLHDLNVDELSDLLHRMEG